jgi:plasmid maintenance system antidote protein VapI
MPHYRNPQWTPRHHRRPALRLAHFFGTAPEFWLNLQSLHEIRLAEQKSGKSIKTLPTLRRTHLARA